MRLDPWLSLPHDVKDRMMRAWLSADEIPDCDAGLRRRDVNGDIIDYSAYKVEEPEPGFRRAWTAINCYNCRDSLAIRIPFDRRVHHICPRCKELTRRLVQRLSMKPEPLTLKCYF